MGILAVTAYSQDVIDPAGKPVDYSGIYTSVSSATAFFYQSTNQTSSALRIRQPDGQEMTLLLKGDDKALIPVALAMSVPYNGKLVNILAHGDECLLRDGAGKEDRYSSADFQVDNPAGKTSESIEKGFIARDISETWGRIRQYNITSEKGVLALVSANNNLPSHLFNRSNTMSDAENSALEAVVKRYAGEIGQ